MVAASWDWTTASSPPGHWTSGQRVTGQTPAGRLTDGTRSGSPLALCWRVYWPLKNLHVELFPLQTPQASRDTLEPRMWSHPTACNQQRNTRQPGPNQSSHHVEKKTKDKQQLNFLWPNLRCSGSVLDRAKKSERNSLLL